MKKYFRDSWYAVSDGSSAFALLGMDIEEFLAEDPEVNEVLGGPYSETKVDDMVDMFNREIQD